MRAQPIEGPRPLRHLQLLAADCLRSDNQVGRADSPAPDACDGRIAGAVEIVVRDVELEPPETMARHEVGDAADRIGAVGRRRALFQHLEPADRDGGNGVHVDESPADETRGHRHLTAAVDQHERPRSPESAQVDVGHVLGERRGLIRVVPAAPLADHAVADAQVLEEIDELRGALLLDRVAADHRDRVGHVDRGRVNRRAGHGHGHFLEQAAEPQRDVHRRRGRGRQLDAARQLLEARQREREGIRAGRQRLERVSSIAVGHNHPRVAGQRRPLGGNGHAGQDAAGIVGYGTGNSAFLRAGSEGAQQHTCHCQNGSRCLLLGTRIIQCYGWVIIRSGSLIARTYYRAGVPNRPDVPLRGVCGSPPESTAADSRWLPGGPCARQAPLRTPRRSGRTTRSTRIPSRRSCGRRHRSSSSDPDCRGCLPCCRAS